MQLNVQRIDERIRKLQEIRRIMADPEMLKILMEFMSMDDERREPGPAADAAGAGVKPHYEETGDLAKVVNQMDEQPRSGGLWGRTRG
jgi:hypothetical protein